VVSLAKSSGLNSFAALTTPAAPFRNGPIFIYGAATPPLRGGEYSTFNISSIRSVFIDRRFNAKSDFSISRVFANVPAKEVTMCKWIGIFLFLSLTVFAASKNLEIYVIDVEGGNATLFVSPSGESLLIDTGNAGAAAPRDACL